MQQTISLQLVNAGKNVDFFYELTQIYLVL